MDEERAKNVYLELQLYENQIKKLREQLQQVDVQVMDAQITQEAIATFSDAKNGDEILIPITNGIFMKAKAQDTQELLINVGAETVVKKSIKESMEMLNENIEQLDKFKEQITDQLKEMTLQEQKLHEELRILM